MVGKNNGSRVASRKEWLKVTNFMERSDLKTGRKNIGGWGGDCVIVIDEMKTVLPPIEELKGK